MIELEQEKTIIGQAMNLAKSGEYQASLLTLEKLGSALNSNIEAIYIKAVCLRKLKRLDAAIDALEHVLSFDENYIRAYQELGHVFVEQGSKQSAIKAYECAIEKDPALIASWRALVELYEANGDSQSAENAKHQVLQLAQLPPALQAVKSHLNRDNLTMADEICRAYLQQNKQDIEGMRLLASIAVRAKILDDAEFILESAVTFEPTHIGARFDYANVLLKRQKFGAAHQVAQELNKQHPNNMQFKSLLASTTTGVGDTQGGISLYQELIAQEKEVPDYYLLLGHALKTAGDIQGAVKSYQALYQHKPDFGDAFWSLANTKTYSFDDDEVAHMQHYKEQSKTSVTDKVHFNFALGKALEDRQNFEGAFRAYEEGNRLNKELLNYQAPEIKKRVEHQISRCNSSLFQSLSKQGYFSSAPIFIVGLPRAGSTLLEQILASHSQVDGTLELPNILSLVNRLQGRDKIKKSEEPPYPRILGEIDPSFFAKFGEQYIEETSVYRQGAPFFIDKMPNNFLHIGLIKLMLPNAKIIDARRHPMSCCFSGFKQLFAEGQEFSYGLAEIGNYYKNYIQLMDHWDAVLPGFVLRVQHEDVVNDLEPQVRRILDFCGLEFEESCLEFYKTDRNVRTPSSEQVRQPIYKTGLEQWRHFEPYLGELIEALGPDILARYLISD